MVGPRIPSAARKQPSQILLRTRTSFAVLGSSAIGTSASLSASSLLSAPCSIVPLSWAWLLQLLSRGLCSSGGEEGSEREWTEVDIVL